MLNQNCNLLVIGERFDIPSGVKIVHGTNTRQVK